MKFKEINYIPLKDGISKLKFKLSGDEVNEVIVNTIRRVLLEHIPIYAFDRETMKLHSTSVYNDDNLKLNISNFPIFNIPNQRETIKFSDLIKNNNKIEENTEKNINKMNVHCDVKYIENDTKYKKNIIDDLLCVTTDLCTFYCDQTEVPSNKIYPNPLLITKLKLNEEIKFDIQSILGIGKIDTIFSSVNTCTYEEKTQNDYDILIDSNGQLDSYELLSRACMVINNKLEHLKDKLLNSTFESKHQAIIELENEDHTLGNIFARALQDHQNIEYAGYKMDHLLIDNITIRIMIDNKKTIYDVIREALDEKIKIYNDIIKSLPKKYQ